LPNVGPYIYDVKISGFTRSSISIYSVYSINYTVYDISRLRVKYTNFTEIQSQRKHITELKP
jgi:hypothetical protein